MQHAGLNLTEWLKKVVKGSSLISMGKEKFKKK